VLRGCPRSGAASAFDVDRDDRLRPAFAQGRVDRRDGGFGHVDAIGRQKHGAAVHQHGRAAVADDVQKDRRDAFEELRLRGIGLFGEVARLGLLRGADRLDAGVEGIGQLAEGVGLRRGAQLRQVQFLGGQRRLDAPVLGGQQRRGSSSSRWIRWPRGSGRKDVPD
jgi:hypothetical protein